MNWVDNGCKYMKIMYVHCGWIKKHKIDPHSYEHYWTSTSNKAWKKFRPVRDLNPWPLRYLCTRIAEVMGLNPERAWFLFFRPYLNY